MHLVTSFLSTTTIILLALLFPNLTTAAANQAKQAPQVRPSTPALLTFRLPPTAACPNPQILPARTYATLTTANLTLSATFRRNSTFVFNDVPVGSYLGEFWTGAAGLNCVPLRVDISASSEEGVTGKEGKEVKVWQTFRGNEWDNRGEMVGKGTGKEGVVIDVQVLGARDVFEKRSGFSPMSLLKNPMILIGIVGLAVMFGMPKLMENMDPEMREEFERQQRAGGGAQSLANALTGQGGASGFDAAGWLAGTSSSKDSGSSPAAGKSSSVESKGGKKRRN